MAQITVRPWHKRKDRSAIERWPSVDLPAGWRAIGSRGPRQTWAIDRDGELVGRISLRDFLLAYSARLGIYLRSDCYGQGIGTVALREFIANVAPVQAVVLDVAHDNPRAIRCYQKVGFSEVERSNGMIRMMMLTPLGKQFLQREYASFCLDVLNAPRQYLA